MEKQIMVAEWGIHDDSMSSRVDYRPAGIFPQFTDSDEETALVQTWKDVGTYATVATLAPEVVYDAGVYDRLSRIEENIKEVKAMLQEIYHMENPDQEILELRDISRRQAKEEIASYFADHHGNKFDEADLQEALKISIWMIVDICEELEKEGRIKGI